MDSNFLQQHVIVVSVVLNVTFAPCSLFICVTIYVNTGPSVCNSLQENENWLLNYVSNSEYIRLVYDSDAVFSKGKFGL